METPLYSKLKSLADQSPLRLHVPGHKGKTEILFQNMVEVDFTELNPTGDLYQPGEPFATAQALWAEKFGFEHCQFLTGGSTQGVYTALSLCGKPHDYVLLDRGAHRSAFHGLGLFRQSPIYLRRPWIKGAEVAGPVEPREVERLLDRHPGVTTVFITSPTYHGVLSDIHTIARVAHRRGCKLVVDGAHGAHLPWLDMDHYSSADIVTISAHKTLPVLGQGAMILYRGFSPSVVASTAALYGTSSPSYAILSSMDIARDWMDRNGAREYERASRRVKTLREIFPCLNEPHPLDPLRFTLICRDGQQMAKELEKLGIYVEMAGAGHIIAIFNGMDTDEEIERFAKAILPHLYRRKPVEDLSPSEVLPWQRISIQNVMFGDKITVPLSQSAGHVAGESISTCPPGVPVVAMGEVISEKELAYLQKIGYNKKEVSVLSPEYVMTLEKIANGKKPPEPVVLQEAPVEKPLPPEHQEQKQAEELLEESLPDVLELPDPQDEEISEESIKEIQDLMEKLGDFFQATEEKKTR